MQVMSDPVGVILRKMRIRTPQNVKPFDVVTEIFYEFHENEFRGCELSFELLFFEFSVGVDHPNAEKATFPKVQAFFINLQVQPQKLCYYLQ